MKHRSNWKGGKKAHIARKKAAGICTDCVNIAIKGQNRCTICSEREKRKQIGDPTGANMYNWLKKNGFPPGFQVLCANCNWSRGRWGYCPHQNEEEQRKLNTAGSLEWV